MILTFPKKANVLSQEKRKKREKFPILPIKPSNRAFFSPPLPRGRDVKNARPPFAVPIFPILRPCRSLLFCAIVRFYRVSSDDSSRFADFNVSNGALSPTRRKKRLGGLWRNFFRLYNITSDGVGGAFRRSRVDGFRFAVPLFYAFYQRFPF